MLKASILTLLLLHAACGPNAGGGTSSSETLLEAPVYTFQVTGSWPHDAAAFTQGLEIHHGLLYESTGGYGSSSLRQVELQTGRVLRKVDVPSQYFAEGITIFQGRIYQLTWQSHKGFIYDLDSFERMGEFAYEGEGWGLTHDDRSLIMSDGTNRIRFLSPVNYAVERSIKVYDRDRPLMKLNELEYIKGEIYANIWKADWIVRLDPENGKILGWIDLKGLLPASERSAETDVLNGIAYDASNERLFVTGKLWPKLFQIGLKKR
ncbi:MAG TPA: glutaminyl-peptide cyclotransferase [Pyrinomonadaceae bacterium]|nr:glutaminyl-peptide cyclotransferase [Pyrinomonadaceae bacterium]